MTSATDALEEAWQIAVKLASAKLTAAQHDTVSKAAKAIAKRLDHRDPNHADNIYRAAFFAEAARVLDDPLLGLNLARNTDPREFGVIFYVMSAAPTAYDALDDLLRFFRLTQSSMTLTLTRDERNVTLAASGPLYFTEIGRQIFEWGTAVLISMLRYLTKESLNPTKVSFTHHRSMGLEEFRTFFGCDVDFGQPKDFITLPAPLDLTIKSADPYLLKVLRAVCEDALAKRGDATVSTLRGKVEKIVVELLPHGRASSENAAKELAISKRTLTRRLAEEGTTFSDLLDELRRALAMHYLHDSKLEFMQIAWLLGYAEVSGFNHAFKRWTSTTPKAAREKLLSARNTDRREIAYPEIR